MPGARSVVRPLRGPHRRWGGALRRQAFSPEAKTLAQGRLCRPEHFKPNGGPRRALPRWGMAAKARYEHLTRLVELYK